MEAFKERIPVDYDKWREAIYDPEIFGPVYYFAERQWYLDTIVKEDGKSINAYDLGDAMPNSRWQVPIPAEVAVRFGLRTPQEPSYMGIH